jgi:hypothetical protein
MPINPQHPLMQLLDSLHDVCRKIDLYQQHPNPDDNQMIGIDLGLIEQRAARLTVEIEVQVRQELRRDRRYARSGEARAPWDRTPEWLIPATETKPAPTPAPIKATTKKSKA